MLEQTTGQDTVGGVNAEGGGDTLEDTEEEGSASVTDTEEWPGGDAIC